jgi:hypothetical protein
MQRRRAQHAFNTLLLRLRIRRPAPDPQPTDERRIGLYADHHSRKSERRFEFTLSA